MNELEIKYKHSIHTINVIQKRFENKKLIAYIETK